MVNEIVIRYSAPTKYDVAKFGTIYKVMGDDESYELFVQLSEEDSVANWQPMSYLLEKTFRSFLTNPDFVSQCLHLFSFKGDRCEHFKRICEILKHEC